MKKKIVQRSPDLGIGIRLKPLAVAPLVVAKEEVPTFINISNVETGTGGGTFSTLHTVTFLESFATSQTYTYSMVDLTTDESVYTIDSIVFSDGVTVVGTTLTVPPGVTSFTIELTFTAEFIFNILYQLRLSSTFGIGSIEGL